MTDAPKGERVAKVIARAGVASRREAERLIEQGRVMVDGKVLTTPAVTVTGANDVRVDGEALRDPGVARLWRYHKPAGLMTSHGDPQGRATIFENLPSALPRVISVGRLDLNSEGLLLLTNDGGLARHMELPSTGWTRRYRVRVHGRVDKAKLETLASGITVSGIQYGPVQATLDEQAGANAWLTVSLREGKNREVRRICEHFGWEVNRLIRIAYGPFQLGAIKRSVVEEVPGKVLREQVGEKFWKQLDADRRG